MKTKKTVLSGIQPTGSLHLGNLFGALHSWVKLQDQYEAFFMIADLHALTTNYDNPGAIRKDSLEIALDLLSVGLDPKKCVIFRQSDVLEHSELFLIFSMLTPIPWLERVPTYKSKIRELKEKDLSSLGFLGYPVLQAADILLYQAEVVPVGEDQLPHLELTREIARRFNFLYQQDLFCEPKELLTKTPNLTGLDGRKMSKSYQNTIALSDSKEVVQKKVSGMVTDPARVKRSDPGHPDICGVYKMHKIFNKSTEVANIGDDCKAAKLGCVDCKKRLAKLLIDYLAPIHEKRAELQKKEGFLKEVLKQGKLQAQERAHQTMQAVRKVVGL